MKEHFTYKTVDRFTTIIVAFANKPVRMELLVKFILLAFALAVVVAEDDIQSLRKEMNEMNLRTRRKVDRLEQELRHVTSELSGGTISTYIFVISIIF